MFYVTGSECRLSKRIYITECQGREGFLRRHLFFELGDMRELKVVHNPTSDEKVDTPNENKGPEALLDLRGSIVDDMHQTM